MLQAGEPVNKRNEEEEQEAGHWRLEKEELHAVHVELSMVACNTDSIQGRREYTCKGEYDAQ